MGNKASGSAFDGPAHDFTHVFLFVNPSSGGNCGAKLTDLGLDCVKWKDPAIELRIFNLKDSTERENGLRQLRH